MYANIQKPRENKSRAFANRSTKKAVNNMSAFRFVDRRPETVTQRKLQQKINRCLQLKHVKNVPEIIQLMKIIGDDNWSLSPHCWDHVHPQSRQLKDEYQDSVLYLNGKTYWPASLLDKMEVIIVESVVKIDASSAWVPTLKKEHKSLGWKLYTHKGIELHLSVTKDKDKYWVHAYPTSSQKQSKRKVLTINTIKK